QLPEPHDQRLDSLDLTPDRLQQVAQALGRQPGAVRLALVLDRTDLRQSPLEIAPEFSDPAAQDGSGLVSAARRIVLDPDPVHLESPAQPRFQLAEAGLDLPADGSIRPLASRLEPSDVPPEPDSLAGGHVVFLLAIPGQVHLEIPTPGG